MQLELGLIEKRVNSTKHTFSPIKTVDAKLKEPTDIKAPVFLLLRSNITIKVDVCNYLHCQWGYYWVDDVVYATNDLVELHCHRDVLATAYDDIKLTEAFVVYAHNSDDALHWYDDERLQPDNIVAPHTQNIRSDYFATDGNDYAIMFTFSGIGFGNTTLILDWATYVYIIETLMQEGKNAVSTIDDMIGNFLGIDWKNSIHSVIMTPFSKAKLDAYYTQKLNSIVIGTLTIGLPGATGYSVISADLPITDVQDVQLSLPMPYDSWENQMRFLYGEKYFSVQMHSSAACYTISSDHFIKWPRLTIENKFFPLSGQHTMEIYVDKRVGGGTPVRGECLLCIRENLSLDMMGFLNGYAMRDTTNAFYKKAEKIIFGGASEHLNMPDVTGIIDNFMPGKVNMSGVSCGGANTLGDYDGASYRLITSLGVPAQFYELVVIPTPDNPYPEYAKLYGYAINEVARLGTFTDYIQCSGASFKQSHSITYHLYPAEISEINTYLNTGFYLEE